MRQQNRDLALVALFVALIAVGAFIRIPIPYVPFTLQFFFTTLAGMLLGAKKGALASGLYVLLGLIGIPIFTQGGGPAYIFQPTFGYLAGFIFGSYATGLLAERKRGVGELFVAAIVGLLIVYVMGCVHLFLIRSMYLKQPIGFVPLLVHGFLLPLPGDIALSLVAAILCRRLRPALKRS